MYDLEYPVMTNDLEVDRERVLCYLLTEHYKKELSKIFIETFNQEAKSEIPQS